MCFAIREQQGARSVVWWLSDGGMCGEGDELVCETFLTCVFFHLLFGGVQRMSTVLYHHSVV